MVTIVNLYSEKQGEINKFLNSYYNTKIILTNSLKWEKYFNNPIEMAELIGAFIDNKEKYMVNMWISLDRNIFINVTENNVDDIIRYLYERFPY